MQKFELLSWDSCFFGFPVARVHSEITRAEELDDVLRALRERGTRLAYWFSRPGELSASAARSLNGTPVGHRVEYCRELGAETADGGAAVVVTPHSGSMAEPELVALAIAAGRLSRFAIDPGMPRGTAERLYRVWVERSIRGEIADAVYLAHSAGGELVGMITTAHDDGVGVIGLVAIEERFRGRGIGRVLVAAAHRHFGARGLETARVATQGENLAACRIYEVCGYRRTRTQAVFHFWL